MASPTSSATALDSYVIKYIHGTKGGIMPPRLDARYTLEKASDESELAITTELTPRRGAAAKQEKTSLGLNDEINTLVSELHEILKSLPNPKGRNTDIYDLNQTIEWSGGGFNWCNAGSAGCGGSVDEATPQEKAKFARAVWIVAKLVGKEDTLDTTMTGLLTPSAK
ncbi:hypothetical protein DFH06DRAFT_1253908 [Mycena polygramma]|nr:hypothetical protein DFH06DRAFT_1253908 [Mycena polygramma]